MPMRVTLAMTYENTVHNINSKQSDISQLSEELSTGVRLQAPSDDPSAWSQAMSIKQGLSELSTFGNNMSFAMGWNQASENALGQFEDLITQAKQTAMKAMQSTTPEEQAANYETMKQMTTQALGLANTQYGNSYIFSGRSTSTTPFNSTDFSYQGDTQSLDVRIGKNTHQTVNQDGQTVFFTDPTDPTTNILQAFDNLATAINTGDTTTIQNEMGVMDQAYNHISSMLGTVGARMSDIQQRQDALQSVTTNNQDALSNTQDADVAEVVTNLQMKQTALQATLQSTAYLKNLSLTNFL